MSAAGSPPSTDTTDARAMVKRWFVGTDTVTESDLNGIVGRLAQGLKDLIAAVGQGHFVLTDFVPPRGATSAAERKFFDAEAFTLRSRHEGMDVAYVEDYFFKSDPGGVIFDQANWTRIVVHAGFPAGKAKENADSWAFFAADCAGVLTNGQRAQALATR